jgi:hypothetical protein
MGKIKFTLYIRRRHLGALSLNIFTGTKYCPSMLETVGIRVPTRGVRNFTMFSCSFGHCPKARCVSVANAVCKCANTINNSYLSVRTLVDPFFFVFIIAFVVSSLCVCLIAIVIVIDH